MTVLIISIIMALFFAILGIVLFRRPGLIAGYARLEEEEKQSTHTKERVRYIRDISVATSITILAGGIISYLAGRESLGMLFILLPPFLMAILILSKGGDKKKRNRYLILFISLLLLGIIFAIYAVGLFQR